MFFGTQSATPPPQGTDYLEKPLIAETQITQEKTNDRMAIIQDIAGENWKLVYAIGYHESGNFTSGLCVRQNNCWGRKSASGGWESWPTFEDGVRDQVSYLERKYFSKGLYTPKQINPMYAEDDSWYIKVQRIIDRI